MKLFKNKIGRPSNEIKLKRTVFILSMVTIITTIISVSISLTVTGINTNKLKGASVPNGSLIKDYGIHVCAIDNYNSQFKTNYSYDHALTAQELGKLKYFFCTNEKLKKSAKGIEYMKSIKSFTLDHSSEIYTIDLSQNTKLEKISISSFPGSQVTNIIFPKSDNIKHLSLSGLYKLKILSITSANLNYVNFFAMNSLKTVSIKSDNLKELHVQTLMGVQTFSVRPVNKKSVAKFDILFLDYVPNMSKTSKDFLINNQKSASKLICPASAQVNTEFSCVVSSNKGSATYTTENLANGYYRSASITKNNKKVNLKYTKAGEITVSYNGVCKIVKIVDPKEPTTLTLTCPTSVKVSEEFRCYTNHEGATIKLPKEGLVSNYSSNWTTTSKDKSIKGKYNIAGKVTVVVSKGGYKEVSKTIEVKGNSVTSRNNSNGLDLTCPTSAAVGEIFRCSTTITGATLSVSKTNLASGYSSSWTTTSSDKTIKAKYNKAGKVTITISKSGYSTVTKYVEIKKLSSASLELVCPTKVKVGEQFRCSTNVAGATLNVSKTNLASGYSSSWTTTSSDKTIKAKYTKPGTIKVTVSKSGYTGITKTIDIVSK